jgi:hypothetical protein
MRTHAQLISLVREWSNRDTEVLSDDIIKDCLRYAADKAYRFLRISPLEATVTYNSTALLAATTASTTYNDSKTELKIPSDLIEFIQIREVDSSNNTTRVFNEKLDLRSYNDYNTTTTSSYWSRQGTTLLLSPGFQTTAIGSPVAIELHYYKRLPALDATYNVSAANYAAGLLTQSTQGTTGASPLYLVTLGGVTTAYDTLAAAQAVGTASTVYFVGNEVANWLRDENERVLLMGALAEAFSFLQEDDQVQKYAAMFKAELAELNDEDKKRNARGGNVQISYSAGGLI